jgi:pyridoxine 4-dehydrogenase
VERIELLQLHRIDPETPLTDQLGTRRELQLAGKVGRIGLSEVSMGQLDRAREIVEVVSVQNRYSLLDREHEPVLRACARAGIAFLPWRPVAPAAAGDHHGRDRTRRHRRSSGARLAACPLAGDPADSGDRPDRAPGGERRRGRVRLSPAQQERLDALA